MAKKEKKQGKPQDPNAWMVTFSDLMTLLLTFFVLLLTMKSMDQKALKSMFGLFSGAIGMLGFGEKSVMMPESLMPPRVMSIDAETLRKMLTAKEIASGPVTESPDVTGAGGKEKEGKTGGKGGGYGEGAGEKGGEMDIITSLLDAARHGALEKEYEAIIDFALGKEKKEGEAEKEEAPDLKDVTVTRTTRGIVIRFPDNVLFASGKARLSPGSLPLLEKLGDFIVAKKYRVEIEGHTDDVPIHTENFPTNWELSTTRAVNVLRYLTARFKIPPDRISALGFADQNPHFLNINDENRAKNRRVVVILYKGDK